MSHATHGPIPRIALVLAMIAAIVAVTSEVADAATFTVTADRITGNDATDDPVPDGCTPADCSLREAVQEANTTAGADEITFEVAGTVALGQPVVLPDDVAGGDLDVTEELAITGHADGTTVDASALGLGAETRIVETDAPLTLVGLTLTGAETSNPGGAVYAQDTTLTLTDSTLRDNAAGGDGGAVFLSSASLVAEGTTFDQNATARNGGAIGSDDYEAVTVTGSTLSGNLTGQNVGAQEFPGGHGGAIDARGEAEDAPLTITQSEFRDNAAVWEGSQARGGAIHQPVGTAVIERSWFQGNGRRGDAVPTAIGGGIALGEVAALELRNSSVVDNAATTFGGGISLEAASGLVSRSYVGENAVIGAVGTAPIGHGGGIQVSIGTATIENTTIHGNESPIGGGGVHVDPDGLAELTHVTLAENGGEAGVFVQDGASATTASSILAANGTNCGGPTPVTSADFNLEDLDTCGLTGPDDLVDTMPSIEVAADNGGDLQGVTADQRGLTMALLEESPAVDSADPARCGVGTIVVDQRGVSRPQGVGCDRGAYELEVEPEPTPTPTEPVCDESTPGETDAPITTGMNRVDGLNRVQTAAVAADAICGDGEAPAVVLTRADLFPDAQAGTPLAIELGAPLLLSDPSSLSPETEEALGRILEEGRTVYLLGGVAALSDAVEDRLEELGYATVRYGGVNRFETAQIIAADGLGDPDTILLTNGGDFADSVVAGAAATTFRDSDDHIDAAVLLTSGEDVSPFTETYLAGRDDGPELITVGAAAGVAHPDAEAVAGPTRFETALAVADRFFPTPTTVGIARHDDFADALTGGAIIGRGEIGPGPMLLSPPDALPGVVEAWLADHAGSVDTAIIFGGTAAISSDVETAITTALGF